MNGIPVERTPEERAKIAADNAKASAEAQRMAEEARLRDIQNGQRPVAVDVAEGLKERLANEDFTQRPATE